MNFRIENVIPMSAQGLWAVLHTPEFDAFMAREYGLKIYSELEKNLSDKMMQRRLRVVTTVNLNFVMQMIYDQILGKAELEYEVIQEKCLNRYAMYWEIVPPVLVDKFRFSGMIRLKPIDEKRCLMIREGNIQIDISMGKLILESIIATKSKIMKHRFRQLVEKWKYEKLIA
ncbi:MAG TPA: hypothetical protein HPQ03_17485 [Deltaproteobacteria bacterium]|nr:hypothetical protein [Deltaproteobacteria bacterium]